MTFVEVGNDTLWFGEFISGHLKGKGFQHKIFNICKGYFFYSCT